MLFLLWFKLITKQTKTSQLNFLKYSQYYKCIILVKYDVPYEILVIKSMPRSSHQTLPWFYPVGFGISENLMWFLFKKYVMILILYIVQFQNVWRRLPTPIFHCLRLFHSPTRRSLSLNAVYIPSFQVLQGRPRFFLPSGFQLIIIFGSRVGSILSTWPHQMSCFPVISTNIVSCLFIFSLIYSFVFLTSLEILADPLNASTSVALILLI